MGVSSDAMLFYGFCLPEEWEPPWANIEDSDWEEWYATGQGVEPPDFDSRAFEWSAEEQAFYDTYWKRKKEVLESCPISIGYHCSSSHTMYYVYFKGTHHRAWRGYPAHISSLEVSSLAQEALFNFARDFLNLEVELYGPDNHKGAADLKIGWWLASYMG